MVSYPHGRKARADEIAVPLETGTALLHKHGDDYLLVGANGTRRVCAPG